MKIKIRTENASAHTDDWPGMDEWLAELREDHRDEPTGDDDVTAEDTGLPRSGALALAPAPAEVRVPAEATAPAGVRVPAEATAPAEVRVLAEAGPALARRLSALAEIPRGPRRGPGPRGGQRPGRGPRRGAGPRRRHRPGGDRR